MSIELLDKIKSMNGFEKDTQNYYKLIACIQALKQSEHINNAFLDQLTEKNTPKLLINIFGLLQNLFVSIDALYDMTRITMSHKYSININMNKNLHELKYIRNDIVGHPTHRTYQTGGVGFSTMSLDQTSMKMIVYETHFFNKKMHEVRYRKIDTLDLIDDYRSEASVIINEVYSHLSKDIIFSELSNMSLQFYETLLLDTFDYGLLQKIKDNYSKDLNIKKESHNRVLWRISLLEMLDNWKEVDPEKKEFVRYMKLQQANKLYEMTSIIENKAPMLLTQPTPELLKAFFRFIKEDENRATHIKTLKDYDHPYYESDLLHMISLTKSNSKARKLLNWLKSQTSEYKVYTIGNALEKYKNVQA